MTKIRGILFDLDNTLIDFMKMKRMACSEAAFAMVGAGLKIEPQKLQKELFDYYLNYGIEGDYPFTDFLKEHDAYSDEILAAAINAYHRVKNAFLEPYPGVIPLFITLIKKGIELGIVTDAPTLKAHLRIDAMKLRGFFDVVITEAMNEEKDGSSAKRYLKSIIDLGVENEETLQGLFYGEKLPAIHKELIERKLSADSICSLDSIQITTFLLYRFNVFDFQMGIALLAHDNSDMSTKFENSNKIKKILLSPCEYIFERHENKNKRCIPPCSKRESKKKYVSPGNRIDRIDRLGIFKKPSRRVSAETFVELRHDLAHPLFKDQEIGIDTDFKMSLNDIYKKGEDIGQRQRIVNLVLENWNAINDIKEFVIECVRGKP